MLEDITVEMIFAYFAILCRVGGAISMSPGLSESYISIKARIVVALGLCMVMYPIAKNNIPPMPESFLEMFLLFIRETLIGIFIGTIAKVLVSIMHMAGMIISFNMGLSAANLFDPTQGTQGSILGVFYTIVALMIIIASDMHHVYLRGIFDSYRFFTPSEPLPFGGFADTLTTTIAESFVVAIQIASPHIVVGLIIMLGAGVMGRLMPQMQVFFVLIPAQIIVGIFIMMVTLSACMMWFMSYYSEIMSNFLVL